MDIPTFDDVLAAHERIAPYIHNTPVLTSSYLNQLSGAELFFKCENLQKVGAFKARGAINAVFGLDDEVAAKGVATHSSGNHAGALSYAAARARHYRHRGHAPHRAGNQESSGAQLRRSHSRMRADPGRPRKPCWSRSLRIPEPTWCTPTMTRA